MTGDESSKASPEAGDRPTGPELELLQWLLETETEVRIYVNLCRTPGRTSAEIAASTGLYPSTVREALVSLHAEGLITRRKRSSEGRGNNPYEYSAIPPANLIERAVPRLQEQLNALCNLGDDLGAEGREGPAGPVSIDIQEESR